MNKETNKKQIIVFFTFLIIGALFLTTGIMVRGNLLFVKGSETIETPITTTSKVSNTQIEVPPVTEIESEITIPPVTTQSSVVINKVVTTTAEKDNRVQITVEIDEKEKQTESEDSMGQGTVIGK